MCQWGCCLIELGVFVSHRYESFVNLDKSYQKLVLLLALIIQSVRKNAESLIHLFFCIFDLLSERVWQAWWIAEWFNHVEKLISGL